MFRKKKAFLISMPGADIETREGVELFFMKNGVDAKVLNHTFDVREI